jgi:exodeoxyribonuclease V gamma subunit
LIGTVPGVRQGTIVRCLYSTLAPKHRLAAWVRFLALSAARPDLAVSAVTLGRGRKSSHGQLIRVSILPALPSGPAGALAALEEVVDLYDRGMREPLPIYSATSAAWAAAAHRGDEADEAARRAWATPFDAPFPLEDSDPEHQIVFGGVAEFGALVRAEPHPDECGPGWAATQTSRFGRLACRLWDGLLAHESWAET